MNSKDFLSIADLTPTEVKHIVKKAAELKNGNPIRPLDGKIFALLFEKPSLRTRVSFEVGIHQLGGECIYLSQKDIGMSTREPLSNIAGVLDKWVDAIIARVHSHTSLKVLAKYTHVPVINALSDLEHPCQALSDLLTIQEKKSTLENVNVTFVGDGNNVASSIAIACASVGTHLTHTSPKGYQIPTKAWEQAIQRGSTSGSKITWMEIPQDAARNADVIYTDVWTSMGQEIEHGNRINDFYEYQVNEKLMRCAKPNAIFMHDMPAHEGEEISKGMLNHPQSVVFDQAENRLHAQKAILTSLFTHAN